MEVERLVAFALGVYAAGGLFALAAARAFARAGSRLGTSAPPPPLREGLADATLAEARETAPVHEARIARPAQEAPPIAPIAPVAAPLAAARESSAPPPLTPEADASSATAPPAEPALAAAAPTTHAPTDVARLVRERDEAIALRAALELEVSEGAPLRERVAWLARRVTELEAREARGEAGAGALAAAARRMLLEQAALAADERDALASALERAHAERAARAAAHASSWQPVIARLAELDRRLDALDRDRARAAEERAERERELEAAHSLVRAERRVADDIRALLAHHLRA